MTSNRTGNGSDAVHEPHCARRTTITNLGAPGIKLVVTPVQILFVPRPPFVICVLHKQGGKRERGKMFGKQAHHTSCKRLRPTTIRKRKYPCKTHAQQTITPSLRRKTNKAQHRRAACGGRTSHPPAISFIGQSGCWCTTTRLAQRFSSTRNRHRIIYLEGIRSYQHQCYAHFLVPYAGESLKTSKRSGRRLAHYRVRRFTISNSYLHELLVWPVRLAAECLDVVIITHHVRSQRLVPPSIVCILS